MGWPPDEPESYIEAELQCEAEVFAEAERAEMCGYTWTAWGDMMPDEDGSYFQPANDEEATCPDCGTKGEYDVMSING